MDPINTADVEKGAYTTEVKSSPVESSSTSSSDVPREINIASERVRANLANKGTGPLARMRHYEALLDKKLGVEGHGPERILPDERNPPRTWMMAFVWASGTMNLSCFATGFLGFEFGLSLTQSICIVVFGTLLGSMVTGWCATMGAPTGLRQVSISRYSLGWWPSKIIAFLNVVEQLGWSSVGCITGGLALSAVSDNRVSSALGVVICAVVGAVFSFIGLRAVLKYDEFAWIVFFVIFMIMYGEAGPKADLSSPSMDSGLGLAGSVLTLLAIVYGSSASWCSIVSDYYVHYPVNTSKQKVFWLTTMGITIPTCIGMVMGCCVGSTMGVNSVWKDTYTNQGLGQLIQIILYPHGFAKFILVLLVLSGIGMNTIAIYSAALSIQQFARPLQLVPRSFWAVLVLVGILLLGLVGRNNLLAYLQNFLSLLGYWNTIFFVIVFIEHYYFRKGDFNNYDLTAWNDPKRMPVGFAGFGAFAIGCVGFILGMSQTWYNGVISRMFGPYGGDVGNQLAFVFTIVTFIPLRHLELRHVGR